MFPSPSFPLAFQLIDRGGCAGCWALSHISTDWCFTPWVLRFVMKWHACLAMVERSCLAVWDNMPQCGEDVSKHRAALHIECRSRWRSFKYRWETCMRNVCHWSQESEIHRPQRFNWSWDEHITSVLFFFLFFVKGAWVYGIPIMMI